MAEENKVVDALSQLFVSIFIMPPAMFVTGWCVGWMIEAFYFGEPFVTEGGWGLKVLLGIIAAAIPLIKVAVALGIILFGLLAALFFMLISKFTK